MNEKKNQSEKLRALKEREKQKYDQKAAITAAINHCQTEGLEICNAS